MKTNKLSIRRWLLPVGFVLATLVIVGGTLQWPVPLVYAFTALMFATVLGARSAERRDRRQR
jgi:hypothetical protein